MKKNYILGVLAVAALALVSCTKEQEIETKVESKGIPFEFVAGTVDTKTVNAGLSTTWAADDQISLFHAVKDAEASTAVYDGAFTASAAGASVAFTGTIADALDGETSYDWYAIYPYSDGVKTANAFDYVTIGSAASGSQVQDGNDSKSHLAGVNYPLWGKKKNVAAATKPAITMKQMASIIEVKVTNKTAVDTKVTNVQFSSSAESNLIGVFRVDLSGDAPAFTESTTNSVASLNVTGADALAEDEFASYFFAVKPFMAAAGSKLTITVTTDQGVQELSNIVPVNFEFSSGKIHTLNFNFTNKTVNLAEFKYNDSSWLTAQSINPGEGSSKDLNGAAQTVGSITITSTDGGTKTRVFKSGTPATYDLRVYKNGGSLTVAPTSSSYVIEKVTFAGSGLTAANLSADSGTYTEATTTWTGLAQDVKFTCVENWNIKNIGVFYRTATASDHILIVPVKAFDAAYTEGSVDITIKRLNVSDLVVSSESAGYVDYSVAGNTITVNYLANGSTSSRNIEVSVSSVSAGVNETVTITQAGAPASISTLSYGAVGTVTAKVAAHCTKGFILADTDAILVYTNSNVSSTYPYGQTLTVGGTVGHYNKGLQFPQDADITPGAAGSYDYPSPTAYTKTEIDDWIADGADRFASYVTLTGVVKKNGTNYDIIVGGGSTANVTLYYPLSTFTSSVAEGDNITVTGYAMCVMSSKCAVIPTNVVNNETTPKIIYSDITGVAAAGVTNQNVSGSAFRVAGWTPTVTFTGCVSAASINAACTQITYSASANALTTEKAGTIVVTFSKSGEEDVQYTINVTQNANMPSVSIDMTAQGYTDQQVVSSVSDAGSIVTVEFAKATGSNDPKYYTSTSSGPALRVYQNNTASFTSAKNIVKIEIYQPSSSTDYCKWDTSVVTGGGTLVNTSRSKTTWTGKAKTVTIKATAASRISNMVIYYEN